MNGIMARYSRSVLLVDDSPADRALFTRELQRAGFDVLATGSAEDAMSVIVAGGVGCLVTDEVMAVTGQELAAIAAGVLCSFLGQLSAGHPFLRAPFSSVKMKRQGSCRRLLIA